MGGNADEQAAVVVGAVEPLLDFRAFAGAGASGGKTRGVGNDSSQSGGKHGQKNDAAPAPVAAGTQEDVAKRRRHHDWGPVSPLADGAMELVFGGFFPTGLLGGDEVLTNGDVPLKREEREEPTRKDDE